MNTSNLISDLITLLLFAAVGYWASSSVPRPRTPLVWIVWIGVTILVSWVGVSAMLISFPGYAAYLNHALQGLGMGILLRFILGKSARSETHITA